ncbi:MAG: hypothetical protein LBK58_10190 [Prevotellaceae bacterium]|jgi:hypothetical protein|nr:hypothetical protein [Prevotellaceae bacterium]
MNFKVHINICVLLVFLSGVNTVTSARSTDTETKGSANSTYHDATGDDPAGAMFGKQTSPLPEMKQVKDGQSENISVATEASSCVNSFTNQTVSSTVSVLGCNILTVQNVTVTGSGNLSLSAPVEVLINGPFEVLSGGILNVTGGGESETYDFTLSYDASGNRISRTLGAETTGAATIDKKSN